MADLARCGEAADERDDVVRRRAGGLGDDEHAVHARRVGLAGHRGPQAAERARDARRRAARASARTRRRASASGAATVAPAARAWPPPPNAPGQDRRVDAAGLRPHGDPRRRRTRLLEQDRDLGRLRLGEEVDQALRVRGSVPGRGEVGVVERAVDDAAAGASPRGDRGRGRRAAAGHPASSGRGGARSPTAARRPRRAPRRRRGSAAWRWGGRTWTCPSRCRPSARRPSGRRRRRGARRAAPRAARRSRTSRPRPGRPSRLARPSVFDAWWSTRTRGSRSNRSRCRSRTAPRRSSEPQSQTTSRS